VNGSEHDRLRPPTSVTPARQRDKSATRGQATTREGGPSHDISTFRIHPADPNTMSKTLDHFAHNSALLTGEHRRALEALAAAIAARVAIATGTRAHITVSGHTDTSGDETYNRGLGTQRAEVTKAALEAALRRKQVADDRIGEIATESLGESRLAKETPDDVKEPLNRRVEITVTIDAPSPSATTSPSPAASASPSPGASGEEPKKRPIDLNLPRDYKLPEESWWQRTERTRKAIEEYDREHPRRARSLTDVIVDGVTRGLEPVIRKLPKNLRAKARDAIRAGIEAGTAKACEAAIDRSGVSGEEAEAMKAACKAALKTKPGGER
jgi:outer membrane protein OmpA-like peptidoglycan-associated protein